jgi:hypothetical protein
MDSKTKIISGLVVALIIASATLLCAMKVLSSDAYVALLSGLVGGFLTGVGAKSDGAKKLLVGGSLLALIGGGPGCAWWDTTGKDEAKMAAQQCLSMCVGEIAKDCSLDALKRCAIQCAAAITTEMTCPVKIQDTK